MTHHPLNQLEELFNTFLLERRITRKLSAATLRNYSAFFNVFRELMPEVLIHLDLTTPKVLLYMERLERRNTRLQNGNYASGLSPSTIKTYTSKLKSFTAWLVLRKHLKEDPCRGIRVPTVTYTDRKYLSQKEVEKIFVATVFTIPWSSEFTKARNVLLLTILLHCGLRRSELVGIRLLDVCLKERQLTVRAETSKSKRSRVLPLNKTVMRTLKEYLAQRRTRQLTTPSLFASARDDKPLGISGLSDIVHTIKRTSGVRFHLHQFRHTFAVNMLNQGCDIAKVKQLLGHTNIKMTALYLRCLPVESLRADVERMSIDKLL